MVEREPRRLVQAGQDPSCSGHRSRLRCDVVLDVTITELVSAPDSQPPALPSRAETLPQMRGKNRDHARPRGRGSSILPTPLHVCLGGRAWERTISSTVIPIYIFVIITNIKDELPIVCLERSNRILKK